MCSFRAILYFKSRIQGNFSIFALLSLSVQESELSKKRKECENLEHEVKKRQKRCLDLVSDVLAPFFASHMLCDGAAVWFNSDDMEDMELHLNVVSWSGNRRASLRMSEAKMSN